MTIPDLSVSGGRLAQIDSMILWLIKRRMDVARQVGAFKEQEKRKEVVRLSIEDERIEQLKAQAEEIGVNPNFAAAFLYELIGESCKVQLIQMQSEEKDYLLPVDSEKRYAFLKRQLLALCEAVAKRYQDSGASRYSATAAFLEHEDKCLFGEIKKLPEDARGLALDLGCGVGRTAKLLAPHFREVRGYDISQHMVSVASGSEYAPNVSFEVADLEDGIPLPDGSVSFVAMTVGTASDLRDAPGIVREIYRVLAPGGRFLLSFYNAEALMYLMGFIPWETGLAAEVNIDERCLTVHVAGKDYLVYARPYTWGEIESIFAGTTLRYDVLQSYPTVASVIPKLALEQEAVATQVKSLDRYIATKGLGAYYLVSGAKV